MTFSYISNTPRNGGKSLYFAADSKVGLSYVGEIWRLFLNPKLLFWSKEIHTLISHVLVQFPVPTKKQFFFINWNNQIILLLKIRNLSYRNTWKVFHFSWAFNHINFVQSTSKVLSIGPTIFTVLIVYKVIHESWFQNETLGVRTSVVHCTSDYIL